MSTRKDAKPDDKADEVRASAAAECRVPDCTREPTTRGLCDAHWASQRGLAEPKGGTDG